MTGAVAPNIVHGALMDSNGPMLARRPAWWPGEVVANEACPEHHYPHCPIPAYVLKMPVSKPRAPAADPAAASGPPPPAECAVSLEFLRSFLNRIPAGANMAKVVDEVVRPSTGASQASYASQAFLVPRCHTGPPTWVVVAPWDLPLAELVAALEEHCAGLPPASVFLWIDALAVSQHMPRPPGGAQALAPLPPSPADDPAGAPGRPPSPVSAFAAQLRAQHAAQVAAQQAVARAAREAALEATRRSVRASRCGALLVLGREARPLRRAWGLLVAAEALRWHGPEGLTLVPLEKGFRRADLVRQLRELDPAATVAASHDPWEREVLAAALGVPPAPPPGSAAAAAGPPLTAYDSAAALGMERSSLRRLASVGASISASASVGASVGFGAGPSGAVGVGEAGDDDGAARGRALVRQLQLALLLRPMDGAMPARMLGATLPDADPVALTPAPASSGPPSASPSTTSLPPAPAPPRPAAPALHTPREPQPEPTPEGAPQPWSFPWLWDWAPVRSWLALPATDPSWTRPLLLTGPPGSGKTTALAALMTPPPPPAAPLPFATPASSSSAAAAAPAPCVVSAALFCSAADARSTTVGEAVRSLSYQLSCSSPGFGAALCGALLTELGGPGGGAGLVPDAWLHGTEAVVAALLAAPLQADVEARAARGEAPATHIILLDGLDEGPAAATAAAAAASTSYGAAACVSYGAGAGAAAPGSAATFELLRLAIDHLSRLPGVRLILSCTAPPSPDADGAAAAATTAAAAAACAVQPPLVAAPPGAADAWGCALVALRRALAPVEVPLRAVRRDQHLPLALAHALQEYVLSPELTARELLWQGRGCLAHVRILQLLVRHAAESLGPTLMDGDAAAAAARGPAAAAAAAAATAAPPEPATAAAAAAPAAAAAAGASKDEADLPPRPQTPPLLPPGVAASEPPPSPPPLSVAGFGAAGTGGGPVGVHAVPPVSRGSLAEEYGMLWRVRTAELAEAAMLEMARAARGDVTGAALAAATAAAAKAAAGLMAHRSAAMSIALVAPPPPLPPPYAPDRAVRLQLMADVLAAAREPLPWEELVRLVLRAEAPPPPPPPPAGGAGPGRGLAAAEVGTLRGAKGLLGPADGGGRGSPHGPRPAPGRLVVGTDSGGGGGGEGTDGDAGSHDSDADDGEWGDDGLEMGATFGGDVGAPQPLERAAARAAVAVRDLEWALHEGPLAGLLWLGGGGRISVRHSSFSQWLRNAAAGGAAVPACAGDGAPARAPLAVRATDHRLRAHRDAAAVQRRRGGGAGEGGLDAAGVPPRPPQRPHRRLPARRPRRPPHRPLLRRPLAQPPLHRLCRRRRRERNALGRRHRHAQGHADGGGLAPAAATAIAAAFSAAVSAAVSSAVSAVR